MNIKNTVIKRIITIFLIIGLISTQFVFASSELTAEEYDNHSETYETEVIDSDDEIESEDEIDEDIGTEVENTDDIRETENPHLRSLPSNFFIDLFDAADYLDEQIVNYLFYNGPSGIEIYIYCEDGVSLAKYQIAYFSKLYSAFCGFDKHLNNSIEDGEGTIHDGGITYYKFTYNIDYLLNKNEAIQAWNSAQTIANAANQIPSFYDKINYINDTIRDIIDYHDNCYGITHNTDPNDKCDTAYSLCTGNALCTGFTGAFDLVCYEAGLNAVPIGGCIKKPIGIYDGHAWNIVEDGNTWKQVDCTFDYTMFGTDLNNTRGLFYYYTTYFKQNHIIGTPYSGWTNTSAGWTYIDTYGYSKVETWLQDSVDWCYVGIDGRMVTNDWAQDSVGFCYMDSSGHITRSAWKHIGNDWYYCKANGYRATNEWIQDSTDWCYMGSDGKMVTNDWAQDSSGWCYLDSNGHITRSQWLLKNNEWYYLKADGHMAANEWAQDSVGWCYMDSNGHITRSQWLQKNGYWYYLKADGHMATNEWIEDSVDWCYMGSDGRMVTSDWAQDSVGWCYMNNSGHITRSAWIQKNSYWYYLKSNGYRAENEWAIDSTGYCWMQSNGRWDTGTKWIGSPFNIGSSYILSGHRVNSTTITIDGYDCTFNGAGQLTTFVRNPGITPGTE